MGVKFAKFLHAKCNVSPLRGEKPQNRPLSKLNTGRFVLRAMLPVKRRAKFIQGSSFFVVLHSSFGVLRVVLARRVRLGLDRVYGSSEDCCLTITLPSLLAAGLA